MKKTRAEAIRAREPYYSTGKPCLKGHISKRSTIDGSCFECRKVNLRDERAAIRESLRTA